MYKTGVIAAAALLLGALSVGPVRAQVQRSGGGGGANAMLMQQYQQAVSDRTQLQADNAKLKKDLDELKKRLDEAKKQVAASKAGASRGEAAQAAALAAARAESASNAKTLADTSNKMKELIDRFRETIANLHTVETERTDLQRQLAQSNTAFDKCAERNYDLYQVTSEILDRYSHQGAFSYLARAEPFTRIKRTQIDNLVLEYKERAEQLRVKKPDAAPGPGAKPSPLNATPPTAESAPPAPK